MQFGFVSPFVVFVVFVVLVLEVLVVLVLVFVGFVVFVVLVGFVVFVLLVGFVVFVGFVVGLETFWIGFAGWTGLTGDTGLLTGCRGTHWLVFWSRTYPCWQTIFRQAFRVLSYDVFWGQGVQDKVDKLYKGFSGGQTDVKLFNLQTLAAASK